MNSKTRMMLAASCAGLLALSIPALSLPSPRGVEKPRAQAHGAVVKKKTTLNVSAKARIKARDARATRLVSTPIGATPQRPMFGWPSLVSEARKYMGTNPTARSRLWCATFMNMVLAKVGYAGTNSDAAKSFAQYGRRISEPQVGAIVVLTRGKKGGHVGVVSGIDKTGNPIIISGNHGHRVGEAIYPRSRVIAYVMPTGSRAPVTQVADRSQPGRASSGLGLESPITELLAAIEAEQSRPERPRQQTAQAPHPVQPAAPQRAAQQSADREPIPVHRARRSLPLDPALAELLGLSESVQATPPQRVAPPQRQRQVEQQVQPSRVVTQMASSGAFGLR
jgi:uncharacterized protein (TIGR02594 family)